MKTIFSFLLLSGFGLGLGLVGCTKEKVPDEPQAREFEMREVSEMAALMSSFEAHMELWKKELSKGQIPAFTSQNEFADFQEVEMTEGFRRDEQFDIFANDMVSSLNSLQKAVQLSDAKGRYNLAVKSCITCHNDYCKGVSSRLEKLYLE